MRTPETRGHEYQLTGGSEKKIKGAKGTLALIRGRGTTSERANGGAITGRQEGRGNGGGGGALKSCRPRGGGGNMKFIGLLTKRWKGLV